MLKILYPYEYAQSVFSIDYAKLYSLGIRGLIFDIDNTLVLHGKDSNSEVDTLFRDLHQMGFKTLLLSNNGEERITRFNREIRTLYISNSKKPRPKNFLRALCLMELEKQQVIFIGDQLFTDILGANLSGLKSILVKFLHRPEETNFGKRRAAENFILNYYKRSKKYQNRLGNISKKETSGV
ncbi:MAG: YqeG family HAD IIIA-type phosphatase [Oscillospiraceae bacterium]|nr:YqeG family HAD IIIA-type phosphatase [Oscillospiraceae bacterium]